MTVLDRFLKYVTFDTQSNEETGTTPSTPGQRVFAEALVKELEAIGMEEISLDENSYVMATLPANTDEKIPVSYTHLWLAGIFFLRLRSSYRHLVG